MSNIQQLKSLIESIEAQLTRAKVLLNELDSSNTDPKPFVMPVAPPLTPPPTPPAPPVVQPAVPLPLFKPDITQLSMDVADAGQVGGPVTNGHIIEGVFDGQNMVGPDGKVYNVPANYASKSKLVEGDQMKLTILPDGTFIYKQIGPVPRKHLTGKLIRDNGGYAVDSENGRRYKVLLASVTYFKGQVGDQVVTFVPEHENSAWAAVEHIIPADQVELHEGDEGLLTSGEDGLLPEETIWTCLNRLQPSPWVIIWTR